MRKPHRRQLPNGGTREYRSKPTYGVIQKLSANYTRRAYTYSGIGTLRVHRIVCLAFHGEPPVPNMDVMHLDEDSHNNTPENLSWGTRKENLNAPGYIAQCRARRGDKSNHAIHRQRKQEQHASTS